MCKDFVTINVFLLKISTMNKKNISRKKHCKLKTHSKYKKRKHVSIYFFKTCWKYYDIIEPLT
ncbi:hypothetical protein KUTeg_018420 [Tegillarca granosa]|uniref:Uncharacterized protein n=1 Tax=Tegillarca granosa TaxID=220873 RepID=A0ABQ9EHT6_TEGGR|nr:hypothetical protein KUTeg_018420 [Tegillarca granosa]